MSKFNPFAKGGATPPTTPTAKPTAPQQPTTTAAPTPPPAGDKKNIFNPFATQNAATTTTSTTTTTTTPPPPRAATASTTTSATTQSTIQNLIGREASRNALKRADSAHRTEEYKKFISFQDENREILKRSSPRAMMHDNTRPIHKFWKASAIVMVLGLAMQWYEQKMRPTIDQALPLTHDGLSISMLSPEQLRELGGAYLGQKPDMHPRAPYDMKKQEEEDQKRLNNPQYVYHTPHPNTPCFPHVVGFRQCMGYITETQGMQPLKKLDQCWIPLQRANMCMLQHRLQPINPDMSNLDVNSIYMIPADHDHLNYDSL